MSYRLLSVAVAAAAAFLVFVIGAASSYFLERPRVLHEAFRAAETLYTQYTDYRTPFDTNLWQPATLDFEAVGRFVPERVQSGYTLYTAGDMQGALLIDSDGRTVHRWSRTFSEIWPDAEHLPQQPREELTAWRKAVVWPNGDVAAVFIAEGITPWGLGVAKLDRDSNLLWRYSGLAHHDIDVGPDGAIYLLTHEIRNEPVPGLPRIQAPYIDDRIVILNGDGEPRMQLSLFDAFMESDYRNFLLSVPRSPIGDYLHANAIDVVTPELAAVHPYSRAGDVVVSLRQPGVIAVVDPDAGRVRWATRGPWIGQHDPDQLPNGNMLLFDNRGHMQPGGVSRVLEFEPLNGRIVWTFAGSRDERFESGLRSAQQRLENGNTLITESDRSRLLEVTPDGDIVWEYVHPVRGGPGDRYRPVVTWGQRYGYDELRFLDTQVPAR